MRPDAIRDLAGRFEAAYNAHVPARLAALYGEQSTVASPGTGYQRGPREIEQGFARWFEGFPDSKLTLEQVVVENDEAAISAVIAGAHRGEFLGLPATGRSFEFRCVLEWTCADGVITSDRRTYDFSGLLITLGVLKVKAAK